MDIRLDWRIEEEHTSQRRGQRRRTRGAFPGWWALLTLIALAFGVGLLLGIGWRLVQGQQALRADLSAVVDDLYARLAARDRVGFMGMQDPEDGEWRALQGAWWEVIQSQPQAFPRSMGLVDVELIGDRAWADVSWSLAGEPVVGRLDFVLGQGGWKLARPHVADWGEVQELALPHVRAQYATLDRDVVQASLPELDRFAEDACRWLGIDDGACRVQIAFTADIEALGPTLLGARARAYVPASVPPSLLRLRALDGDPIYVLAVLSLSDLEDEIDGRLAALYPGLPPDIWRSAQWIRPRGTWMGMAWYSPIGERDGRWLVTPSPRWNGVTEPGTLPAVAQMALRRAIAEQLVRERLGMLTGSRADVAGMWALAVGAAEWLALQPGAPDPQLPWSSLSEVGMALLDGDASPMARRQALDAATYVAAMWGPEAFGVLLGEMQRNATLEGALIEALTIDANGFEAGWRAFRQR